MGYTKSIATRATHWDSFLLFTLSLFSLSFVTRPCWRRVVLSSCTRPSRPHRLSEVCKGSGRVGRCCLTIKFLLSYFTSSPSSFIIVAITGAWEGKRKGKIFRARNPSSCIHPHFIVVLLRVRLSDFFISCCITHVTTGRVLDK